jgi:hypothetical protein
MANTARDVKTAKPKARKKKPSAAIAEQPIRATLGDTTEFALGLILRQHDTMIGHLIAQVDATADERRAKRDRRTEKDRSHREADAASRANAMEMLKGLLPLALQYMAPQPAHVICSGCAKKSGVGHPAAPPPPPPMGVPSNWASIPIDGDDELFAQAAEALGIEESVFEKIVDSMMTFFIANPTAYDGVERAFASMPQEYSAIFDALLSVGRRRVARKAAVAQPTTSGDAKSNVQPISRGPRKRPH